jgi:hypothetical protein
MTVKVYRVDGTVGVYPHAYIYWEFGDDGTENDDGFRISAMPGTGTHITAFVRPSECTQIIITPDTDGEAADGGYETGSALWQMQQILQEIARERGRQHGLWGKQNHPMIHYPFNSREMACLREALQAMNDDTTKPLCWYQILMEEVYEAFAETVLEDQRTELIQVAAVVVQIIECLDRRMEEAKDV